MHKFTKKCYFWAEETLNRRAMKFRWFRNFLKGCSLTTALFIFQACYGTGPGYQRDLAEQEIEFQVTDGEGNPISNAKVYAKLDENEVYWSDSTYTEDNGTAILYLYNPEQVTPVLRVEAEGYKANNALVNQFGKANVVLDKAE